MKNLKKLLSLLLALTMILSLAACSNSSSSDSGKDSGAANAGGDTSDAGADTADEIDWPKSTITIVCPYTAGGGTDMMARILSDKMAERLGVSVIVEDQPGGSGAVGMANVAATKNDGYTIILTALGASTVTPVMNDTGYTVDDFDFISQVTMVPNCFAVRSDMGVNTWEELIEYAKANGPINWGCSGQSSPQFLNMVLLTESAGVSDLFNLIPFDGGSASVTALLGSQIDATCNIISEPYQYVQDGTFKVLWVTSECEEYPDAPTTEDLGMSGGFGLWYGFAAPDGTDERILDKLDAVIAECMALEEVQEQFKNIGQPCVYSDRATFSALVAESAETNLNILTDLGLAK